MMISNLNTFSRTAMAAAVVLLCVCTVSAAPINYGDFSDIPPGSVMYLDVTETANSAGDEAPLFGEPTIHTNKLDFDPAGFNAAAQDNLTDITDGQLNTTIMSELGITAISVMERGDLSVSGGGPARVRYVLSFIPTVLEVDGVALPSPTPLPGVISSGAEDNSNGAIDRLWRLGLLYDVNAALAQAGIDGNATKLEIVIDNRLEAAAAPGSTAFISKKDFMINTAVVPEPTSVALLGMALCGLGMAGRRKS